MLLINATMMTLNFIEIAIHFDEQNDEVDKRLMKLYALIHEYGDQDTKKFIEQMPYYS